MSTSERKYFCGVCNASVEEEDKFCEQPDSVVHEISFRYYYDEKNQKQTYTPTNSNAITASTSIANAIQTERANTVKQLYSPNSAIVVALTQFSYNKMFILG